MLQRMKRSRKGASPAELIMRDGRKASKTHYVSSDHTCSRFQEPDILDNPEPLIPNSSNSTEVDPNPDDLHPCSDCGRGRPCTECNEGDLTAEHICTAGHAVSVSAKIVLQKKPRFQAQIYRGPVDVCFSCPCGLRFPSEHEARAYLEGITPKSGHTNKFTTPDAAKHLVKHIWERQHQLPTTRTEMSDSTGDVVGQNSALPNAEDPSPSRLGSSGGKNS
ncbi:hypothetical protein FB451DRAFT_1166755 [Mycena latifolia]|nr:hypothetical protein FB451DRAFT_1166755 [Mycena latifolia]